MMVTHGKLAVSLAFALVLFGTIAAPDPGLAQSLRDASVGLFISDTVGGCNVQPFGCDADPPPTLNGNLNTPYYVFLAVFNGDFEAGIAGLTCGIDYNAGSTLVHEWVRCADLEFPFNGWPAPGTGNIITFNRETNCQTNEPEGNGVTAIFGYFYVTAYGADRMEVTAHELLQSGAEFAVADCQSAETHLKVSERAGYVGFNEEGDLPCVEKSDITWGQLKIKSDDWN